MKFFLHRKQEHQNQKRQDAFLEVLWAALLAVAALLIFVSLFSGFSDFAGDTVSDAPQQGRVIKRDPASERIRAEDMALACASGLSSYSYSSAGHRVLESVRAGVNNNGITRTHPIYYKDNSITFVGVRYIGVPGNVTCLMDGNRIIGVSWSSQHTGMEIQLQSRY